MSSSSDSEDAEIKARLMASVDLNIYSDAMYKENTGKDNNKEVLVQKSHILKSNRYIENAEEIFQSDLNVPEATKKYVGEKLSKMIKIQYEFVDPPSSKTSKTKRVKECVKLLSSAPVIDLEKDPNPDIIQFPNKNYKIKRRVVESEPDEKCKIFESCLPLHLIQSGTNFWKSRRKSKVFEYRMQNNVAVQLEPKTEWTDLRKKNNWTEDKISRSRLRKNHTKRSH